MLTKPITYVTIFIVILFEGICLMTEGQKNLKNS